MPGRHQDASDAVVILEHKNCCGELWCHWIQSAAEPNREEVTSVWPIDNTLKSDYYVPILLLRTYTASSNFDYWLCQLQ